MSTEPPVRNGRISVEHHYEIADQILALCGLTPSQRGRIKSARIDYTQNALLTVTFTTLGPYDDE